MITDNQADLSKVWNALKAVAKKYPFAVALASSQSMALVSNDKPLILWIQVPQAANQRIWTIRQAV